LFLTFHFLLDGGDNNDSFSNVNMPIPFPDAVQEFTSDPQLLLAAIDKFIGRRLRPATLDKVDQYYQKLAAQTGTTDSSTNTDNQLDIGPVGDEVAGPLQLRRRERLTELDDAAFRLERSKGLAEPRDHPRIGAQEASMERCGGAGDGRFLL